MIEIRREHRATYLRNCRILAVVSTIAALFYLKWLLFDAVPENTFLYWLLVAAELFNIAQAAGFWYTISVQRWNDLEVPNFAASRDTVDIFVTVMGEPLDVVEHTVNAALAIRHPRTRVWILDDGKNDELRHFAEWHSVGYLTRPDNRGAKAGNVNEALKRTGGDYFVIFDADQAAYPEFLEKTLAGFDDPRVAFVQTPQVYRNRFDNRVAAGAHDQQALFYGPILRGKDGCDAVFSCGTNVVYRRSAIDAIGGLPEDSITEDLRGSLLLIEKGFTSLYVSEVLAEGLGPLDVQSYFKQQFRWGRGGLEILFKRKPYSSGLSLKQAVQYSLSFIYWFTGWAYVGYLVLPILFMTTGLRPVQVPNEYPAHFLPYVTSALATIIYASDFKVRFDALWFTLASFPVHTAAFLSMFFGQRVGFVVTPKHKSQVTLRPVAVHIAIIALLTVTSAWGIIAALSGPVDAGPSILNNVAWAIAHIVLLQGFVRLTLRPEQPEPEREEL